MNSANVWIISCLKNRYTCSPKLSIMITSLPPNVEAKTYYLHLTILNLSYPRVRSIDGRLPLTIILVQLAASILSLAEPLSGQFFSLPFCLVDF